MLVCIWLPYSKLIARGQENHLTNTKDSWRLLNTDIADMDAGGILEDDVAELSWQFEQSACVEGRAGGRGSGLLRGALFHGRSDDAVELWADHKLQGLLSLLEFGRPGTFPLAVPR